MPDYATFKVNITVITPLHIGSGRELLKDYDFAVHNRQTWRINDAALLDAQDVDDPGLADRLAQIPPAQLLQDADYRPGSPFFRYILPGEPRSQQGGAQVREQIKDTFDRPYLPGSSLKGALRTVLARHAWYALDMQADLRSINERSPKFAAQPYEQRLFAPNTPRRGREPNHDLLRALQVGDSLPLGADCLRLINATVLNRAGQLASIPVEMEAVRANTRFEATLKLDMALFSAWARQQDLRLEGEAWLRSLPAIGRAYAAARFQQEAAWFDGMHSAARLLAFYQQLANTTLQSNQFLLQLGWGTGWDAKTIGEPLRADSRLMAYVIDKHPTARKRWQAGQPFPKSRKTVVAAGKSPSGQRSEVPVAPLGWLLVELEPLHGQLDWQELDPQILARYTARRSSPAQPSSAQALRPAAPAQPPAAPQPATPLPSAPSDIRTPPTPRPAPEPVLVASFGELPKAGQRFEGTVFDSAEDGALWLEIPGLDPDETAVACIASQDNPLKRRYRPGAVVLCEVLRTAPDPDQKNHWLVHCRRIE